MKRQLKKEIIDRLTKANLWINQIENDCRNQKVFMAIRNDKIGFYHKGGLLFSFDESNGFKTHIKYAAVIESNVKDYLSEADLSNSKPITDFESNYKRIKENCSKYSGVEASGVSDIYHKYSYFSDNDVVVLDIEVSFKSNDILVNDELSNKKTTQDRIDILLFKKSTKTLQFVEAKHYSNTEIWSSTKPKVIGQIKKYEGQIKQNEQEIIEQYGNYVNSINNLFQINLPLPEKIDPKVTLLIFGYDRNQFNGRMKELILNKEDYKEIELYKIGGVSKINTGTLWKRGKRGIL
jgi:hypothetical protein